MPGDAVRTAEHTRATRRRSRVPEGTRARTPARTSPATAPGGGLVANSVLLVSLVGVLIVVGLVMVLSASSVEALAQYGSAWFYFKHQIVWVVIGGVGLLVCSRIDYHRWARWGSPLLGVCLVLLVAVRIPHVGVLVDGSSRWLGAGSWRFQPSELTKLALVIFGADVLARRSGRGQPWMPAVRPVLIAFALSGLLIILQPDMGTAMILGVITIGLLFEAGAPLRTIGASLAGSAGIAVFVGFVAPYRRARLLSFVNPWAHRNTSGYQVVQSLVGLASGHLIGVGLGASRSKFGFLPNAYTDFIFSVIGEELGLVGSLMVVGLFLALAVIGLRVAARAPDRFGALVAAAITCWLTGQAVLNIGAVIGMLPVTGVPLPFISYGGSSLAIEMAAVGIMLNVAVRGARSRP